VAAAHGQSHAAAFPQLCRLAGCTARQTESNLDCSAAAVDLVASGWLSSEHMVRSSTADCGHLHIAPVQKRAVDGHGLRP